MISDSPRSEDLEVRRDLKRVWTEGPRRRWARAGSPAVLAVVCAVALVGAIGCPKAPDSATAEWKVANADGSHYTVSVRVSPQRGSSLRTSGTLPARSELPRRVENGDGDVLELRLGPDGSEVVLDGRFIAEVEPASGCSHSECNGSGTACITKSGMECEEIEDGCIDYQCGGGGGIVPLDVGFTSSRPFPEG